MAVNTRFLPEQAAVDENDLLYLIDPDDATEHADGTAKRVSIETLHTRMTIRGYREPVAVVASSGGVLNLDVSSGVNTFRCALSEATAVNVVNADAGFEYPVVLVLTQSASGHLVTWPPGTVWSGGQAPDVSAAGIHKILLAYYDDGNSVQILANASTGYA
jgi:hypothetical protein